MSHTNKGHRVIIQIADLSARPAISRGQSTCVSVITSTPITRRKYGVIFCAGILVAMILLLAFLLSPANHVAPVYNYPLYAGEGQRLMSHKLRSRLHIHQTSPL